MSEKGAAISNYAAWRISYQSSEQAAMAAYNALEMAWAELDRLREQLAANPLAVVPDTHVMVPKEPTPELIEAIAAASTNAVWPHSFGEYAQRIRRTNARRAHRAVIAAAPSLRTLTAEEWERMERDAARYRFIRHQDTDLDKLCADNWGPDGEVYSGEALDAAIDAAIAKQEGGLAQGNEG